MFMLTSTHKAAMAAVSSLHDHLQAEAKGLATDLKRANEARDNWRDTSKDWEAKFKKAVADLEKADREIEELRAELGSEALVIAGLHTANGQCADHIANLNDEIATLRPDAQKWRDSLKRSRDRKAAKKTPPARDKRAKNRGGDRG